MQVREVFFTDKRNCQVLTRDENTGLAPDSVRIKNRYSLISPGTELALWTKTHIGFEDPDIAWCRYPIKAGYSSVGTIEAVGSNIKNWEVGQNVVHFQTHADFSVLDPKKDIILPLSDPEHMKCALFTRFAQISFTAAQASNCSGFALVLGGGIIGNMCAQIMKQFFDRKTILADISANRVALAERCGLKAVNNSSDSNFRETLQDLTNGAGVSTVVEATGVNSMVSYALELMNTHGETILLSSTRGLAEINVYKLIHRKFAALIGAHENRYPKFAYGNKPSHYSFAKAALEGILSEKLKVEPFITDIISPYEMNDAYEALLNTPEQHIGIIIDWERK